MTIAKRSVLIAIAILIALAQISQAETLALPENSVSSNGTWKAEKPRRGMNKSQVESVFGAPDSKAGPTGEPPIYYWEYPNYTVYFESDYVIHSVSKYRYPVVRN